MAKVVAIDAGHGINTPGKRTPDGEREWSFNKVVAESIIKELGNYDVKTVRLDDPTGKTDVALSTRTNKANHAKADILVSCHHNANTGTWGSWTGTETYSYPSSANGEKLAQAVHPHIVKAYGLRDRGLKTANFHMLRESNMPAILIEGGFMDSAIDIKKLRDDGVLKKAGKNIAKGIVEYLGLKKASSKPAKPSTSKPSNSTYTGDSVVDYLKSIKQPSDFASRAKLAKQHGIANYKGTTSQNTTLLNKLRGGSAPSKPKAKPKTLKVGQTVTLKKSASRFATGESIASHAKGKKYKIIQVKSDRVLLDNIISWVKKSDVQ